MKFGGIGGIGLWGGLGCSLVNGFCHDSQALPPSYAVDTMAVALASSSSSMYALEEMLSRLFAPFTLVLRR
jgi:hypothetical protein